LRHVATTRLARLHKDALELSATTGHKTLNVLKKYYNPTPEERATQIRAREAALAREAERQKRVVEGAASGGASVIRLRPKA
jgi:hypothetical protein